MARAFIIKIQGEEYRITCPPSRDGREPVRKLADFLWMLRGAAEHADMWYDEHGFPYESGKMEELTEELAREFLRLVPVFEWGE